MKDKTLPDKEIVKALECCVTKEDCNGCPYDEINDCIKGHEEDILDLINRQQAEIERLKEIIEYKDICIEAREDIKSEAYKEFAEKLENRILSMLTTATLEEKEIICACIGTNNNLLKELVGENDAR